MKVCKYAGDVNDEYCKSCDGIMMEVEGKEISCEDCAGYEAGDTDVDTDTGEVTEEPMNPPVEEPKKEAKSKTTQKANTATKSKQVTNTTGKAKTAVNEASNNTEKTDKEAVKIAEEKHKEEESEYTPTGIHITSLRYTSGATIKKGDNYFKFIAEEEWDVSQAKQDIQDVREQLWAKLNAEVDAQIEELNSMN